MRLFEELESAIAVELDGEPVGARSRACRGSARPTATVRRTAAEAVTGGLEPGLRTRAYVFNTLLADKAIDDRLRKFPAWVASRNLANEASDESVEALVEAVQGRYSIPQRWYRLKARLLGVDRIADYDRMASVATSEAEFGCAEARELVLDSYASFSPELADIAREVLRRAVDRRAGAAGQARRRVLRVHGAVAPPLRAAELDLAPARRADARARARPRPARVLARPQGVFHQGTPLTLAETASVFGETVTFGRLLDGDDRSRGAARAAGGEPRGSDRDRVPSGRDEPLRGRACTPRGASRASSRSTTSTSTGSRRQSAMLGDSVELTDGYRTWWSYIPHFIATPGYVYAYAYGQLLALAVYAQYEERGAEFVPQYLELLAAGGSRSPEELGKIVGVDLADPAFWDGGLDIVERQLALTEAAAARVGAAVAANIHP